MRYFDLIFTLHAQDALRSRGIKIADAWHTFKHPTKTYHGKHGEEQFEREFDDFKVTVVAAQNKSNEWVVKSVWRNPALPGTADARKKVVWKKYNKAGIWGKLWIQLKEQLGF
jgi:hypothetical protein